MKVLFVIAHLDKGGGQAVQVRQLMERLLPLVDGEFLALTSLPQVEPGTRDGPSTIVGPLRFPEGLRILRREIRRRRGKVDLVQAFDPYYALPAARLAGASPLVMRMGAHPVEDFASRYGTPGRWAMRAGAIWLYSGTTVVVNAQHLRSEFPGRPVEYIPNGVDVDRFPERRDPEGARRELGLPAGVPLAIYTGKVIPRKNLEDLFRLADRLPSLHVVLVGNFNEPYYGDRYYRELLAGFPNVGTRVRAVGEVGMASIPRYLEAGDLFVFPSRLEGMPNSVLEALAAGIPVVASRTDAHAEIIAPDTGRMYRDVDELVGQATELLADETLRRRLGARARAVVRERFSLEAAARAYVELYSALLAGDRRPGAAQDPRRGA
jgi:glycosyltransferase involved in cell wall biosynthesis